MTHPHSTQQPAVQLDLLASSLVVREFSFTDPVVLKEAQHWTTGRRGPAVEDPTALASADLTAYLTEVVVLGSRALSAMGQSGEARAVEQMLREVSEKTASATGEAAELTRRAVCEAAKTLDRATADAKKSITEVEERSRKEVTTAVEAAQKAIVEELRATLGGESPALVERLKPLLDAFGSSVGESARAATDALLRQAVKQFDPADPTSPVAKLSIALAQQQEAVTARLDKNHRELSAAVTALATVVEVGRERSKVVALSPMKGRGFENAVAALMHELAGGLGDEYELTGTAGGLVPRSKKGDAVLHVGGADARVVVEVTDSGARRQWGGYFDEAERNRGAVAALGIVRTPDQNNGHQVRVLGPRRVVLAFDPEADEPELLRTVVQLLRASALAASGRSGAAEIATAEEHIAAAMEKLTDVDVIKRTAEGIARSAQTIQSRCAAVRTAISRLLDEALSVLAGAHHRPTDGPGQSTITDAAS